MKKSTSFPPRSGSARCAWCSSSRGAVPVAVGGDRVDRGQDRLHGRRRCCNWVRQDERDSGQRDGLDHGRAQRIKELEREVRELRRANEILKLASAFFAQAELDRRFKW